MRRKYLTGLSLLALIGACARAPSMRSPVPASVSAQPPTDVYLFRFGRFGVGQGIFNITNRPGYDNQPSWDSNSRILYTSESSGQNDIYQIDFEKSLIERVTN